MYIQIDQKTKVKKRKKSVTFGKGGPDAVVSLMLPGLIFFVEAVNLDGSWD